MVLFMVLGFLFQDGLHLYSGATFYTLDDQATKARVVLVEGGRIKYVGVKVPAELENRIQRRTDLGGGFAFPGLIDAHAHLAALGRGLRQIDLKGTTSYQQVIERVRQAARERPEGQWLIGRGWDQNDWATKAFPHHAALSRAVPNHPVMLKRVDGHACLINARAMDVLGLDDSAKAPSGGSILRDENGVTGIFIDRAMGLVRLPKPSPAQVRASLLAAFNEVLAHGLTAVHDAGVDREVLDQLVDLAQSGQLPLRVYAMLSTDDADLVRERLEMGPKRYGDGMLVVRALKVYADGALGSRGAWLNQPYSDAADQSGLQLIEDQAFDSIISRAAKAGFQVNTHAIGDRANGFVLDHVQHAIARGELTTHARFRIEHAQVVDMKDFDRFAQLGVIPSMQPTHCTSDMPWAPERLGAARIAGAYAWQRFITRGLVVPMGSDFPVEEVDPLLGLYAAVTTQRPDGTPQNGYRPDQKLSRMQALKGFTAWAAFAAFQEDVQGKLQPGYWADFTVLDRDLMTCEPADLLNANVTMTVVGGQTRFESARQ